MTPERTHAKFSRAAAAGVLCTLLVLAGCSGDDETAKAETAQPALTVSTATPSRVMLPLRLTANGNVAAWQEAVIGSEASGLRLTDVNVNVGDVVEKGEVLAEFADETVKADVAQARAALQEARANAAEAKANAQRALALRSSGALSEQQISQYVTAEQTANARVQAAEATLEQQQVRLRHTRVVAPDSGVISSRSATVGSVVGVGTELFRLIRQGRLEWRADVTASEIGLIKPGTPALVRAVNGAELAGKVRSIAPTIDQQNRTALVYVDLPSMMTGDSPFKAGMFATGHFDLGQAQALTVPQGAIAVRDGFSYVYRVTPDSRVRQVKVQTGRRTGDRVEIRGGIDASTPIVVSGAGFLNDGDVVRNVPHNAPEPAQRVGSPPAPPAKGPA